MLRRDYLMRLLEQMARTLARVRELLASGNTAGARTELQRAARDAGLDLQLALSLAPASLVPLLSSAGDLDRGRCALFGELLSLERQRALADGMTEYAHRCAARALWFYDVAYENSAPDEATAARMDELRAAISQPS